jgi:mono/diheme cytochrome c family protein
MTIYNKTIVRSGKLITLALIVLLILSHNIFAQSNKEKELDGFKLWIQNCGRCHNYRGLNEFNDSQWEIIIKHMRVTANIPGKESRAILKYLKMSNHPHLELELKRGELIETEIGVQIDRREILEGNLASGKELYEKNCTTCHGTSGKGDGPAAKSFSPKPRDLTDEDYMRTLTDEHLYRVISGGGKALGKSPYMPPWEALLERQDIINLIYYIRSLSKTNVPELD